MNSELLLVFYDSKKHNSEYEALYTSNFQFLENSILYSLGRISMSYTYNKCEIIYVLRLNSENHSQNKNESNTVNTNTQFILTLSSNENRLWILKGN